MGWLKYGISLSSGTRKEKFHIYKQPCITFFII